MYFRLRTPSLAVSYVGICCIVKQVWSPSSYGIGEWSCASFPDALSVLLPKHHLRINTVGAHESTFSFLESYYGSINGRGLQLGQNYH